MAKRKTFIIEVREVHIQKMRVKGCSTLKGAMKKVADGGGEVVEGSLEYSHTLDPETWVGYEEEER